MKGDIYEVIKAFEKCDIKEQTRIIMDFSNEFKKCGQMPVSCFIKNISKEYHLGLDKYHILKDFNMNNGQDEKALDYLFQKFPDNTNLDEVYAKVVTLNYMYNAGLYKNDNMKRISVREMAIYLRNIWTEANLNNVDSLVAVERIGDKKNIYTNSTQDRQSVYSFASKYMSFTYRNRKNRRKPDGVPITDTLSRKTLKCFERAKKVDLENYRSFYMIMNELMKDYKSVDEHIGFKEIDAFLWTIGKAFS